jgi:colicin import membrane protein
MKHAYIISVILVLIISSCSQSRMELDTKVYELSLKVDSLSSQIDALTEENKMLDEEITWIENEIVAVNQLKQSKLAESESAPISKSSVKSSAKSSTKSSAKSPAKTSEKSTTGQCKALTTAGNRCSRMALKGSEYCWQHIKVYEPDRPEKGVSPTGSVSNDSGTYVIHTGPNGGKYYIDSNGKKIYIKK